MCAHISLRELYMPIRTVVFDLGGVLIDWNPEYVYHKLIPYPRHRQWFLSNICNRTWNLEQDRGRSLAEGTQVLLNQHPEHTDWIRAFYDRWIEMLGGELKDGVDLLHALKTSGLPLYALTNWSTETFPYARKNYSCLNHFRAILVSGELGMIKPEPAIYNAMFKRISCDLPNLEPQEIVFIDDAKQNTEAAQQLGWQSVHHQDIRSTRAALRSLGLSV